MRVWLLAGLLLVAVIAAAVVVAREDDEPCTFESWSYTFGASTAGGVDPESTPEDALAWFLTEGDARRKQLPTDPEDYTREQRARRVAFTAGNVRLYAQDFSGTWAIDSGERICP